MKRRFGMILICMAVCIALPGAHAGGGQEDATAPSGAAYRVYIDEATGGIVSRPNGTQPVVLDKEAQNALSTSSVGLQETPSPVAGGGMIVHLDGRFQNTMMATVDENGRLIAPCVSGLPVDDSTTKEQP